MPKFCDDHWARLRKAVEDRGMGHLSAKTGQQAFEDLKAQMEGRDTDENWDPLMAAHWAIMSRVMNNVGNSNGPAAALGFMAGDDCPLCIIQGSYDWWFKDGRTGPPSVHHMNSQQWIDSCMDAMLKHAREKGLMPKVQ